MKNIIKGKILNNDLNLSPEEFIVLEKNEDLIKLYISHLPYDHNLSTHTYNRICTSNSILEQLQKIEDENFLLDIYHNYILSSYIYIDEDFFSEIHNNYYHLTNNIKNREKRELYYQKILADLKKDILSKPSEQEVNSSIIELYLDNKQYDKIATITWLKDKNAINDITAKIKKQYPLNSYPFPPFLESKIDEFKDQYNVISLRGLLYAYASKSSLEMANFIVSRLNNIMIDVNLSDTFGNCFIYEMYSLLYNILHSSESNYQTITELVKKNNDIAYLFPELLND